MVGAQNSSNSNRLREIGAAGGRPSYLIDSADSLDLAWLDGARAVGITAGASAPERLVQELVERLAAAYDVDVETLAGIEENVHFRLPLGARRAGARAPARQTSRSDHGNPSSPADPRRRLHPQATPARRATSIRWC